jgi:hypothetical protein
MRDSLHGPKGFLVLALPLAGTAALGWTQIREVTVILALMFLARYVIGLKRPLLTALGLAIACSLFYPVEVYGDGPIHIALTWLGRGVLALAFVTSLPYLILRPHELLRSMFPDSEVKTGTRRVMASIGWLLILLTAVVVARVFSLETGEAQAKLFTFSFGILSWIPLLLATLPPLWALLVYFLKRGSLAAGVLLMPTLVALDMLTFQHVVAQLTALMVMGLIPASLVFQKDTLKAVVVYLWISGLAAAAWITLMPEQSYPVLILLLAQVAGLAFLRRCHLSEEAHPLSVVGSAFRTLSPLHWLGDLCLPFLRHLDGPGPVWD